jgi:hypothetical protein
MPRQTLSDRRERRQRDLLRQRSLDRLDLSERALRAVERFLRLPAPTQEEYVKVFCVVNSARLPAIQAALAERYAAGVERVACLVSERDLRRIIAAEYRRVRSEARRDLDALEQPLSLGEFQDLFQEDRVL